MDRHVCTSQTPNPDLILSSTLKQVFWSSVDHRKCPHFQHMSSLSVKAEIGPHKDRSTTHTCPISRLTFALVTEPTGLPQLLCHSQLQLLPAGLTGFGQPIIPNQYQRGAEWQQLLPWQPNATSRQPDTSKSIHRPSVIHTHTHTHTHTLCVFTGTVYCADGLICSQTHTHTHSLSICLIDSSLSGSERVRLSEQQDRIKRYFIMLAFNAVNCYPELSAHSCATHHAFTNLQDTAASEESFPKLHDAWNSLQCKHPIIHWAPWPPTATEGVLWRHFLSLFTTEWPNKPAGGCDEPVKLQRQGKVNMKKGSPSNERQRLWTPLRMTKTLYCH